MSNEKGMKSRTLFNRIIEIDNVTSDSIGRIVCLEYGVSAEKYKEIVNDIESKLPFFSENRERFANYCDLLDEYEVDIKNNLDAYKILLYSFMQSKCYTKDQFLREENIDAADFNYAVNVVSFLDTNFYEKFVESLEEKQLALNSLCIASCEKIVEQLNNGVEEGNGLVRKFDIVDYYELLPIPPKKAFHVVKNSFPARELLNFKIFSRKFDSDVNMSYNSIQQKFNDRIEYGCKIDENNSLIPGSGKVVSNEDKAKIFMYLINNNVPLTEATYNAMLIRYRNKHLGLNDKKIKVKVKKCSQI